MAKGRKKSKIIINSTEKNLIDQDDLLMINPEVGMDKNSRRKSSKSTIKRTYKIAK